MQRVLATDPIAHWMQDEKQGGVSYDMVTARSNGARNGAYTGVDLGQPGIGDGRTAPFFDGANDFNNIQTASLAPAFNGREGSVLAWIRPAAGAFADGVTRYIIRLRVDANNDIDMRKIAAANTFNTRYLANGVNNTQNHAITDALHSVGMTWSLSAGVNGEVRSYIDGIQSGATLVALGAWTANPLTSATIGAAGLAPGLVWHGEIPHVPIWDRPLSSAEMLSVGVL